MRYRNAITTSLLFLITLFSYQNCSETSFRKKQQASTTSFANKAPNIDFVPQNQVIMVGSSALFEVGVSGDGFFEYQWYRNGMALQNEVASLVDISNAEMSDAGEYAVDIYFNDSLFQRLSARLTVLLCQDGDTIQCTDPITGIGGTATCSSDGMNYGACVPGSVPPANDPLPSSQSKKSCQLPWGGTLAHGESVKAYKDDDPVDKCSSQTRLCYDGYLSGSYKKKSCKVKQGYWKCTSNCRIPNLPSVSAMAGNNCPSSGSKCSTTSTKSCRFCAQAGGMFATQCVRYETAKFQCKN